MTIEQANIYNGKLKAVIFDWAGTTVDFGSFAPTGVFIEVFKTEGVDVSVDEARGPMGMHKRDHIRTLFQTHHISTEWKKVHGREWTEDDVERLFQAFIPLQLNVIEKHSTLVPGVIEAVAEIRKRGMKIGTTTGYNNEMMKILTAAAARQGYVPDSVVCATDVTAGRPSPWMAFKNAEILNVFPMQSILKIGDTIADIEEGLNAGMWSVGVISSGNELGMMPEDVLSIEPEHLEMIKNEVRYRFLKAGAHYVIDTLFEMSDLIDWVNEKLELGYHP